MRIDVSGKIREKKLSFNNTLLPLFEAVDNAIHAIQEDEDSILGNIEIEVVRSKQTSIEFENSTSLTPVEDFIITDNGVGFNEENYESFNYAHSTYKLHKGGKGIGRFVWLRAFRKVEVESVYRSNGSLMKRTFNFESTKTGVENHENTLFECKNYNNYTNTFKITKKGLSEMV